VSNLVPAPETPLTITRNEDVRRGIIRLEHQIHEYNAEHGLPEPDMPLWHAFAPGAYARTIFIPAGTLVVGKIHKHAHLNILIRGRVSVATEEGPMELEAPRVMTSKAGTKRVVYAHTAVLWTTIHLTNKTDIAEIEDEIIAKSYDEYDALQDSDVLQLLPLTERKGDV
jgi:hypothetical protein